MRPCLRQVLPLTPAKSHFVLRAPLAHVACGAFAVVAVEFIVVAAVVADVFVAVADVWAAVM